MKSFSRRRTDRIIFVTGTDTGVGKTLLTGLLLHHLRAEGCHALAMKPFCSGGTSDVDFLGTVQDGELTAKEMNPFYFAEPVAPLVSARKHQRKITLIEAVKSIKKIATRCEILIVEGSGGLLVPLGENFSVATLIKSLKCEIIVVAKNRLGVINHTLLTVVALRQLGCRKMKVVLMDGDAMDYSARSNALILSELIDEMPMKAPLIPIGYLGKDATNLEAVKDSSKKIKKMLAQVLK
jgi:dethiobiotin synthetase